MAHIQFAVKVHSANLFLLLYELPENLSVFNINFSLHYGASLAGNVKGHLMRSTTQADEGLKPYVSLMEALESYPG